MIDAKIGSDSLGFNVKFALSSNFVKSFQLEGIARFNKLKSVIVTFSCHTRQLPVSHRLSLYPDFLAQNRLQMVYPGRAPFHHVILGGNKHFGSLT